MSAITPQLLHAAECVIPSASEQLLINPPIAVQRPDGSNGLSANPSGDPTSFFEVTLKNVPANLSVTDGVYPGWSVDALGPLCWRQDPSLVNAITHPILYSSLDPAALQAAGLPSENWNEVNYILNNIDKWEKIGANRSEIQLAIWQLIGGDAAEEEKLLQASVLYSGYPLGDLLKVQAIVQTARAFGSDFQPDSAGITAVILESPSARQNDGKARQLMIIEVMCSPPGIICGEIFCDFNCDGVEDKTEADLEGVRVDLFNASTGAFIASRISDGAGHYAFEDLPAGSYTVVVDESTAPKWCNIIGSCPGDVKVFLRTGEILKGINFCFCPPPPPKGEIGDTVFCDLNRNGLQDDGEPGIPGIRVTLSCETATGTTEREMFTNADGSYLFTGLSPGTCTVTVDSTTAPPECGIVIPECPTKKVIELQSGQSFRDADFCFAPPPKGQIGDTVFCDMNDNGIQDANEPGLPGVRVTLFCVTPSGTIEREMFTDANGRYLFTGLSAGICDVEVDPSTAPEDCNETTPKCPTEMRVNLRSGESFLDADFCFAPPKGQIGDTVFCDENRNGVQDNNEPGIPGVTVRIVCDTIVGPFSDTAVTDANGKYLFTGLFPGTCTVTVDQSTAPLACNETTPQCPTEMEVMLDPGESFLDADFCFSPPPRGEIGDTVFCDENRNGVQDANEPGIPGVTVRIECDTIAGPFSDSAVTDANGKYLFTGLFPGTCTVTVDQSTAPDDCRETVPQCPQVITVNLGRGESFLDADFCFSPPPRGEIGDTVFCDENRNGVQDPGEAGLPGVVVTIECQTVDGTFQDVTVTNDDGFYLFTNLPPGTCTVEVDPSTAPLDCNVTIPNCPPSMTVDLGPGESFLDADFCFARCPLDLQAFCKVPPPPSSGVDDCDSGKPRTITMLYTGDNCSVMSHSQDSSKATCTGANTLPDTVFIVASEKEDGSGNIFFQGTVNQGETFTLDARGGKFGSATFFRIFAAQGGQVVQSVEFHTSCSQPLAVGNQFGAGLITEIVFDDGRVVGGPVDPGGDGLDKDCEIVIGGGDVCEDSSAKGLDFLYTGDGCEATSTQQDPDKVVCQSFGQALPDTAFIVVSDKEKASDVLSGNGKIFFSGNVTIGEVFSALAANAGENKFSGSTYIHVFASAQGNLLQMVEFHTSCSQPLVPGDQYGASQLVSGVDEDGRNFSTGASVTFVYQVTNEAQAGGAPLENVVVTDAFGEVDGSPIAVIAPGQTVELERTVTVSEGVFNHVTAVAEGEDCQAQDSTTVRVVPGGGALECDGKIAATLLTYTGPAISSPTTVVFDSNNVRVTYNLPNGLFPGDTLSRADQNDFTIDARSGGESEFNSKMSIMINGVEEVHHTSCSTPYIAQRPAPLDDPKGDPSPLWFVERFRDSEGNDSGPVTEPEPPLPAENALTRLIASASIQAGATVQASVDFSNRGDNDLRLSLHHVTDATIIVEASVNLNVGVGRQEFILNLPSDTPAGSDYVWKAHLLPAGATLEADALVTLELGATVLGNGDEPGNGDVPGNGDEPTTDALGQVAMPTTVTSPSTISLEVPYEVTERRELRIWLHDSENGWFTIGQGNTTVERGSGVHTFSIPILPNARPGSGYVWALRILPLTWVDANDAIDAAYEHVVVERDTSGGGSIDALGNVNIPTVLQPAETYTVTVDFEVTARADLGIWLHNPADNWRVVGHGLTKVSAGAGTEVFNIGIAGDPLIADGYIWAVRLLPEGWTSGDDALDAFYAEASIEERSNNLVNFALAAEASATQSSVYGSIFTAALARDGITDGDWRNASVTHTLLDTNAWLELDLGAVKQINHILIWNRTDCCGDRLMPYFVLVSDSPFVSTDLDASRNQAGVDSYSFTELPLPTQRVDVGRSGRYVRVQLAGSNYLSLAEVEVFGAGSGFASRSLTANRSGSRQVTEEGEISDDSPILTPEFGQEGANPTDSSARLRVRADDNADGDLLDLTAEYALGRNPSAASMDDIGLHLAGGSDGNSVTVWYDRPARLNEIGYVLEHSSDLQTWTPIHGSEVQTDSYGWERVRYPNLERRQGISIDRGFVRLRINHYDWNHETTTPVCGWQRTVLHGGHQTHGVSLNRIPEYASTIVEVEEQQLLMASGGLASRMTFHDAYYVEILNGTHAGHRFEVDEDASGDQRIVIDLTSELNTLAALPDEGLAGASLLVRPHWTFDDIYPAEAFQGSTDPDQADQLLFFNGLGYDSFFLLEGAGRLHWTMLGNNALEDVDNTILAPGEGCFINRATDAQLPILVTGHVRTGAFYQPLRQGYNLVANSRPLDLNVLERGLTTDNGFLGGTDPATSDQIQRWLGDEDPGLASYEGYFLLDAGENSEFRHWTQLDDVSLGNSNEHVLFPADRAVFLRLTGEDHPQYRYNP